MFFYADSPTETPDTAPLAQLETLRHSGVCTDSTLVWVDGMDDWAPLGDPAAAAAVESAAAAASCSSPASTVSPPSPVATGTDGTDGCRIIPFYRHLRYARGGQADGDSVEMSDEVTVAEFRLLLADHTDGADGGHGVCATTMVWTEGMEDWAVGRISLPSPLPTLLL